VTGFKNDESPTAPDMRVNLRLAAERLMTYPVQDLVILERLRRDSKNSPEDLERYREMSARFVNMLLGR
jgi:hypothetical protein